MDTENDIDKNSVAETQFFGNSNNELDLED